uniref:Uncharacterized protein n=1 Tax=candidate division WOR-3 bacterium TaxID=2052148 RepID=A0A7C4XF23_UNCW3
MKSYGLIGLLIGLVTVGILVYKAGNIYTWRTLPSPRFNGEGRARGGVSGALAPDVCPEHR